MDGLPYTTIIYGNGPGALGEREDLLTADTSKFETQGAVHIDNLRIGIEKVLDTFVHVGSLHEVKKIFSWSL